MSPQPLVPEPSRMRAGDADRDAILSVIQDAFANGRLSTAEVSERQERALTSVYTDELLPIVVDLPEGQAVAARWGVPAPQQRFAASPVPDTGDTRFVVMSGRAYALRPGETWVRNVVIMGGDTIDTTPAFGPGVTVTIHDDMVMGGHTTRVPARRSCKNWRSGSHAAQTNGTSSKLAAIQPEVCISPPDTCCHTK